MRAPSLPGRNNGLQDVVRALLDRRDEVYVVTINHREHEVQRPCRATRDDIPCKLQLAATPKSSADDPWIAPAMNARKNNHEVLKSSVPQDVGKTSKDSTTGSPVALRIREGIVRNPRDRGVHRPRNSPPSP